jgi:hypothetical protein
MNQIKGKNRLKMLENRVLRKTSGCKKRINGWRKLHHKEVYVLFVAEYYYMNKTQSNSTSTGSYTYGKGDNCILTFGRNTWRREIIRHCGDWISSFWPLKGRLWSILLITWSVNTTSYQVICTQIQISESHLWLKGLIWNRLAKLYHEPSAFCTPANNYMQNEWVYHVID